VGGETLSRERGGPEGKKGVFLGEQATKRTATGCKKKPKKKALHYRKKQVRVKRRSKRKRLEGT